MQRQPMMALAPTQSQDDSFQFAVRYRTEEIEGGAPWLDYSLHPASKLGLHNALLAEHDRIEILQARGGWFDCGVFVLRHGQAERLTQEGAERLFAALPHGNVKWIDLCRCLLPPLPETLLNKEPASPAVGDVQAPAQLPLFEHTHTLYDDVEEHPVHHILDVAA